jgi:hypothetical protein
MSKHGTSIRRIALDIIGVSQSSARKMMRKCSSTTPGNNGIMREDHATKHDKNCSELHCGIVFCFKMFQGASVSHVSPKAHSEPATSPDMLT